MTSAQIESAWAFGGTEELKQHASAQAIATMWLWLVAGAPSDEFPAKQAFTHWLARDDVDTGAEDAR